MGFHNAVMLFMCANMCFVNGGYLRFGKRRMHFLESQTAVTNLGVAPMMGPSMVAPIGSAYGPAPSTVNVQGAMNPRLVPGQNSAAVCPPAPPGGTAPACVVGGSSATVAADDSTGQTVGYVIGGIFGLITVASIFNKYKTMGSYSSFWGRMIGLISGAGALSLGYSDFSAYSANECANLFGEDSMSSPCPCMICVYVLGAYALFQFGFNLPFLYANEKTISKMYASMGLFSQAGLMFTVSGGTAGFMKFASGSLMSMVVGCLGIIASVMFLLGWFKGEDGVLGRMFQGAKDMISNAAQAATAMVDDGLKMFGLNADERSKVTLQNVYTFARVGPGPDWSSGESAVETGGEIIGYLGENGLADGVPVSTGKSGWAKVKWDSAIDGQPAKTGEYRIGAEGKFELKLIEESEGVVDKLLSQTYGMFGYTSSPIVGKEKQQIEFILSYTLVGESPDEESANLQDDQASDDEQVKKVSEKQKQAAAAAAAAASKDMLILKCTVFDANGRLVDTCDDKKPMLFKSAIRHRQLGKKQNAIVVELQKLPANAQIMCLSLNVPTGTKLSHWESLNLKATSTGHEISKLAVSPVEGANFLTANPTSTGGIMLILGLDAPPAVEAWFAEKLVSTSHTVEDQIGKFREKRASEQIKLTKKSKKKDPKPPISSKFISIDEIFSNIKFEVRCENQAREIISTKIDATTKILAERLRAQGVDASNCQLQAKKLAVLQINKQQQIIYQKTFLARRAIYLKNRLHPVYALQLATADAKRAAMYDGKEAEVKQAVRNTMAEEAEAIEEAKRLQDADAANTVTGQASALIAGFWGTEEPTKKKSKKKHKKNAQPDEETQPFVAATPAALPPQLANLTPQQLAAVRAMQQRQLAAKQAPPPV